MSNEHYETLREFNEFIAGAVEDFADSEQDPSDYCFEVADGSQYSIYYSHAWDLVNAMRHRNIVALRDAEMDYADVFPMSDDANLDTRMTRLAYLLTHAALAEELQPA